MIKRKDLKITQSVQARINMRKRYNVKLKTTKICPNCLGSALARLSSVKLKKCADCNHEFPWTLESGQRSIT